MILCFGTSPSFLLQVLMFTHQERRFNSNRVQGLEAFSGLPQPQHQYDFL
jgi:hypothetical protein